MLRQIIYLLSCVAISYSCYQYFDNLSAGLAPVGLLISAHLLARPMAKMAIGIIPAIRDLAHFSVHHQWQGRYYTFNERQVRFYVADDIVWVAAADIAAIMTPPPQERESRLQGADFGNIPGEKIKGYTEAAVLRMLATRNASRRADREMIRFRNWLEGEAFPNVKRLPSSSSN